ncbi:TIGR03085 family metal-binding protein [Phycicoccus sp. 3266]|uniref:TIGR03085 family metal-binding protein n=1 Tax=Phycicoccus sp. 3266 TaxID=2817751 RepID=UPI00285A875D|nr:TIGR03085 family metal-binding protein [Phycicoccus sp. 3266]MDR6865168.1 uncharacterized protein (TIGR03085 family) [Phycicoccus sp. 3266]
MTSLARRERFSLCDTFARTGPDAPTLCSPWTTADLAAHLVIRDRRPDLGVGIVLPPLAGRLEDGMKEYAAKPWAELVDLVRSGPPVWSPLRVPQLDDVANLSEYFVHHEDVLRGDETPGPRRQVSPELSDALWSQLSRVARLCFRRSPVGVVLSTPDGRRIHARGTTELGTVVLEGPPEELLLAAFGRHRVADLEVTGGDDAVAALWAAPVGLG